MKHKKWIYILLVVIVSLSLSSAGLAQYPGYSAGSAYQVVNVSNEKAQIVVQYYDQNGVAKASRSFTDVEANGGSRLVLVPRDETTLGAGRYSAVISSDREIVSIVNQEFILDNPNTPQPPFASYSGVSKGGTSVFLPAVMYNYYNYFTEIFIQNVGDADATDVRIEYIPATVNGVVVGTPQVENNISIKRNASVPKSQQNMTSLGAPAGSGGFTGRFFGSAMITSSQPLAVVVNEHNVTQKKLMSYNGFTAGSTKLISPTALRGWYTYYTALTLVNMSQTQKACVRLTYYPDLTSASNLVRVDGTTNFTSVTAEFVIDPKNAILRYEGDEASDSQSDLKSVYSRFTGSVVIESFAGTVGGVACTSQPLAGIMNVEAKAGTNFRNQSGSFNVMDALTATNKVIIPTVLANWYGYYTVISLANTSNLAGACDITYTSGPGSTVGSGVKKTYTRPLAANGSFMIYEGNPTAPDSRSDINADPYWRAGGSIGRFTGAAEIVCKTATNTPIPIVSFINEEVDKLGIDSMYTFNAVNK